MSLPVMVHSETFKKALKFLVDHDYSFEDHRDLDDNDDESVDKNDKDREEDKETLAIQLRKRQAKCDLKIAEAIEKLRRAQYQMDFYEKFSNSSTANNPNHGQQQQQQQSSVESSSVQRHLTNTILDQNRYLSMLKEEPLSAKYASKDYLTQPGQACLDPAQGDAEGLLACADAEM